MIRIMADNNHKLGLEIHEHLKRLGLETPMRPEHEEEKLIARKFLAQDAFSSILLGLGLDLDDDSIKDTPRRLSKMYHDEICWGMDYEKFPSCTTVSNKFNYDELVIIRDIEVKSLCEHHFMPIIGRATIAYIPTQKVLGLSKFNRIVEFFSRRPQVQERLTEQIAATLRYILGSDDIAVIIAAGHYCVKFRGIEDICSDTVTSKMLGRFRTKPELRAELMSLVSHGAHSNSANT
jgi:GTP cyclohydrolase I